MTGSPKHTEIEGEVPASWYIDLKRHHDAYKDRVRVLEAENDTERTAHEATAERLAETLAENKKLRDKR